MALTQQDVRRMRAGNPSRFVRVRHHGQVQLAEVVPIRPPDLPPGSRTRRRKAKLAQVVASLRVQATTGVTPPPPPSLPAPFGTPPSAAAPDDAA